MISATEALSHSMKYQRRLYDKAITEVSKKIDGAMIAGKTHVTVTIPEPTYASIEAELTGRGYQLSVSDSSEDTIDITLSWKDAT